MRNNLLQPSGKPARPAELGPSCAIPDYSGADDVIKPKSVMSKLRTMRSHEKQLFATFWNASPLLDQACRSWDQLCNSGLIGRRLHDEKPKNVMSKLGTIRNREKLFFDTIWKASPLLDQE